MAAVRTLLGEVAAMAAKGNQRAQELIEELGRILPDALAKAEHFPQWRELVGELFADLDGPGRPGVSRRRLPRR